MGLPQRPLQHDGFNGGLLPNTHVLREEVTGRRPGQHEELDGWDPSVIRVM